MDKSRAGQTLGWYIALLGLVIVFGGVENHLSVLAGINFSQLPIGSQNLPLVAAVILWAVGAVFVIQGYLDARRAA